MNIKLSFYPRSNHFTALLLAAALSLGSATVSHAASIIVPAGVQPGDTYRIIFVTSAKRNATSSNIADYNQFVTNAANLSPELQSLNTTWTALASTSATNVLANTGLSLSDTNTRFFHTFGQLIATGVSGSNSSLFGGATTLHGARISTEAGVFVIGPNNVSLVWTGTNDEGDTVAQAFLGNDRVSIGNSSMPDRRWIAVSSVPNSEQLSLYGVSGVLTAPSGIPEPSTVILLGSTLLAVGLARLRRNAR
ncbi:MAG: PEP-CTERM sorting domain-containing protein [Acidobacteria bacterium]|nr:PEP-CTERM sorting domain-containing protein [Acidobacteriota bacterium]